ncbi:putative ubiquitin c-terminal hydrolase family protein [Neofusicoccum parvum UCRNP2]|uniref:Putative ubiquitin c-terminal hydrolase family protein n=1 Tax=Botryosphaeria parva (strain UCR-NP2) TaxID=1287680 RepID=R1EFA4_BOTPV|nr:putative ubiquitin c-terminal hydrolase family protein [Neofusicoccum parvum UCRNP2]
MSAKYGGEIMEGMSRFLSRRGKRSAGEKRKSLNNIEEKPPPQPVPSDLYNIFHAEEDKKQDKEEEKKKVKAISQRLAAHGITTLKDPQIIYALRSRITNGDLKEALELLVIFEDSIEGILREYNPSTKLLGAENRC